MFGFWNLVFNIPDGEHSFQAFNKQNKISMLQVLKMGFPKKFDSPIAGNTVQSSVGSLELHLVVLQAPHRDPGPRRTLVLELRASSLPF